MKEWKAKWLGKWIIYNFEFKCFSGSVCCILISLKLTLCNLFKAGFAATRYFCRTADDWFWWGGADSEQRAQRATAAMWCQAGGGGGLLSHCPTLASAAASSPASSCTCAEALQSLGGRAGSPAQQLSWNTILAWVGVNVPGMLETPQRYSFQEQVYPLHCWFSSVTLVIIAWSVELIVL